MTSRLRTIVPLLAALGWSACHADVEGAAPILAAPPRADFNAVSDAMNLTCATLDCHGQIGRNMRLYGGHGLRLDPMGRSDEDPTTAAEYDANYWSIVGLEPDAMSAVVRDGGADPERLSLIRKPRGLDDHKGKTVVQPDDALDRCLRSWLAARVDTGECSKAVDEAARPTPMM